MPSNSLNRIAVVGSSGSGKTTFAAALAESLGIPAVDLDALHWGPNWTPRRKDDFHADLLAATAGERWIVSGNYREARPLFWPRVTTVVWLNYSFPVVFNRALRRTVRRIITQEPICNGNRESFRLSFCSRESVLLYMLTTFHRRRREYAQMRVDGPHAHLEWIEFRRPREADEFLARVRADCIADVQSSDSTSPISRAAAGVGHGNNHYLGGIDAFENQPVGKTRNANPSNRLDFDGK